MNFLMVLYWCKLSFLLFGNEFIPHTICDSISDI